jgi:hypothetical protein
MENLVEQGGYPKEKIKNKRVPNNEIASVDEKKKNDRIEELERIIDEAYKTRDLDDEESKKKRTERMTAFLKYADGEEKSEAGKKIFEFIMDEMRRDAEFENEARIRIAEIGLQKGSKFTESQKVNLMKAADRPDKFETEEVKTIFEEIPAEYKTVVVEQYLKRGKAEVAEKIVDEYLDLQLSQVAKEEFIKAGKDDFVVKHADIFRVTEKSESDKSDERAEIKITIDLETAENLGESEALEMMQDEEGATLVARHLKKFKELGYEVAMKLINFGKKRETAEDIDSFCPEFHKDISLNIIERGGVEYIVENHAKFNSLDYQKRIPEYPGKTTLKDLIEIFKWPGLGGMEIINTMRNLKDFSFKEHILPIIKAQKEQTSYFFRAIKKQFGEKFTKEEVEHIVYIAECGQSV